MQRILTFFIFSLINFTSSADNKSCEKHPEIIEARFDVNGKLEFWNGSPSVRIKLNNGRVLGVSEGLFYKRGYDTLPPGILKGLNFDLSLKANFKVCPFTSNKPEVMQLVCVQSFKNGQLVNRE